MNTMIQRIPDDAQLAALERYSFSDQAAQLIHRERPASSIINGRKISDVWKAIREDGAYGLIPFENSSGGVVRDHFQELTHDESASIVGEVQLKVQMCLGGLADSVLEKANVLCSHQKGLDQTSEFFNQHDGLQKTQEFSSTVDAVRYVRDSNDPRIIAAASRQAIEAFGLTVLAEDVANLKGDENVTQFFVMHRNGKRPLPHPEARYHAAIVTPATDARGVIHQITGIVFNARMNLSSLQSQGNVKLKKYRFFLEMEREGTSAEVEAMARMLECHHMVESIRWLGSWDDRWQND